jgi:predicted transposase/invertase (TIGR01784 family)
MHSISWISTPPIPKKDANWKNASGQNYAYELAAKFEQGLEKGMEKGEFKKALETARRMREEGFSIQEISELTGLTILQLKDHGIL